MANWTWHLFEIRLACVDFVGRKPLKVQIFIFVEKHMDVQVRRTIIERAAALWSDDWEGHGSQKQGLHKSLTLKII